MIPFNPAIFLIMAIISIIALAAPFLILYSLLFSLRVYFIARKEQVPFIRLLFKSKFFIVVFSISVVFSTIAIIIALAIYSFKKDFERKQEYMESRQYFVLEHEHLYGEFLFPKGTLINRNDSRDIGEEVYLPVLSGLDRVRFSEPTEIAGILATAMDIMGYIEIAEDQQIGPVHYFPRKSQLGNEPLVDRTLPFMHCKKGSVAVFERSRKRRFSDRAYHWRYADGADAEFSPSEWKFRYCDEKRTIDVLPAYGSQEAIQLENERKKQTRIKNSSVIKDGVLMDAEEVVFNISYLLEAQQQYLFSRNKNLQTEDYLKIYELFEKAAENGEEEAYYYLGIMNDAGEGVPQDREKALYWFHKSVDTGNEEALARMGSIYLHDEEVQDYTKAREIFEKTVESERNETAEYYLGRIYAEGLGVEQDYQQALEWFKKSADPFHAIGMTGYHPLALRAMLKVGKLYEEGLVGEKDYTAAEPWYDKACHLELQEACEHLKDMMQQGITLQ
ncbi:tetratricopeptide repeat protein [Ignatzschineria sp. LJL83]